MSKSSHGESQPAVVDCDVCVLGAGIAGLNALFAVSRHLSPSDKIVVVDRQPAPAGMWRTTYSYVRLHQPHPMFTVGNIRWRDQPDPYHLATRQEVQDHLTHCFEQVSARVKLEPYFGYSYLHHEDGPDAVIVECRRDADGAPLRIRARRLIKGFGYNIPVQKPLELSSRQVSSLVPELPDLVPQIAQQGDAPIYIVGGGKTGMDTAHLLVRALPKRKVRMLIGQGTLFLDRDRTSPGRWRRYFTGDTPLDIFLDVAKHFNGRNEQEVLRYFRENYCVSLDAECRRYMFGLMSQRENREIKQGLDEVIRDHLVDIVDEPSGPTMVLRSGARRPIEPGAVILNCSGYLGASLEYEPYLSSTGRVLSISGASTVHFLSSQSAYFLGHLFMLGKLADAPLYEVDVAALRDASRDVFPPAAIAVTLYNTSVILGLLPRWVMQENGLDLMGLYPLHRRLFSVAKLMLFLKLRPTHLRDVLDVVRERFHVRLGPLSQARPQAAPHAELEPVPSLS